MSAEAIKALTIRQPHASLVALGIKTIETRTRRTNYRGPIAIHAGRARPKVETDGLAKVGGWWIEDQGHRLIMHRDITDPDEFEALDRGEFDVTLPLGAVVATANLVDCWPIVTPETGPPAGCGADAAVLEIDGVGLYLWLHGDGEVPDGDVSDQLPFGDFTPGRWAWLLDDVRPLAEPIPWKGQLGLWNWTPPDSFFWGSVQQPEGAA